MPDSDSDSDSGKEKSGMTSGAVPPPYSGPGPAYQAYPQPAPAAQYPQPYPQPSTVIPVQQGYYTTNAQGQQVFVTQVTSTSKSTFEDLRGAIPIMPMPMAILCFILNCIIPGIGTVTASFTVFCCANVGQSAGGKIGCFCLNFWIGWLQLFTIWLFLLGWIWSIMWGWAFIAASAELYARQEGVRTTVITETPVAYTVPRN